MKTRIMTLHNANSTRPMSEPGPGREPVLALLIRLLFGAALVLQVCGAQAAAVLTTLHSFHVFASGAYPHAELVQGIDDNFYGTTSGGGTNDAGTVFRINTNGALTTLYSFTGGGDGSQPAAGLVQGGDGTFYGTTSGGGTNGGQGTVFKISTNGALTSLYSFTGGGDGSQPAAGLVQGSNGDFYGTSSTGGATGYGTVFKISTNGMMTTLYTFGSITNANGDPLDGANPTAALVQGGDGSFYGTTAAGGTYTNYVWGAGNGTVFKITPNGALTSLYSFGAVHDTNGLPLDGANPTAGLVQGKDGDFYGTTYSGGNALITDTDGVARPLGTVFKINTNGMLTTLYAFSGTNDGASPHAGLVQGSDGNFYGTTEFNSYQIGCPFCNGAEGPGTVFTMTPNGALTTLYSFSGGNDSGNPLARLVQGRDGIFYGTTSGIFGGPTPLGVGGTVFTIGPNREYSTLYSFSAADGAFPHAALVQGRDGNLYGTTEYNGPNLPERIGVPPPGYGSGTVFKISANGALSRLYSFTGGDDGANPQGGLVEGIDGYFYGTTQGGGTNGGGGTVFKVSPDVALTSLYSFAAAGFGGFGGSSD